MSLIRQDCKRCDGAGYSPVIDGEALRQMRGAVAMSMSALAKRMKVSITYIWMLETNQRPVTEIRAKRYLMALDDVASAAAASARKEK